MKRISIVVPVFNEEENITPLYRELKNVLGSMGTKYEVIFIDDGSNDASGETLKRLAQQDKMVKLIQFRKNFGQTAAIAAGVEHAQGEIIVTMDGDRQNDPRDIPRLLEKLEEGYDVASGWRRSRKDPFLNKGFPSALANKLISWLTGVKLHDYGCTLKAYRRNILKDIRLYGEMHRFIPVYANRFGAKIIEVPVRHHERKYGKAKYGLERTIKVILDLFTVKFLVSYSSKPIYLFGGAGVALIIASALLLLFLFIRRVFFLVSVTQSPLFLISTVAGLMGFQSILMGLIAELLVRTYHESQGKPIYNVREFLAGK